MVFSVAYEVGFLQWVLPMAVMFFFFLISK
jgi:hypothetical protein